VNKKPTVTPGARSQRSRRGNAGPPKDATRDIAAAPRFYYKGSRIKQLRAFCMIVKLGTLSRAAEALFLSQPSISLQLRALEQELGATLIERRRRRVAPTREGQALYDLALPLVEGLDQLDQRFRASQAGLAGGELHIAAGTSTIQYLLPPFVAAFREQRPGVKLQLHNVTGKDGLALLRSDQVDFAVGSMLDVPNDLSYEPVQSYDPMLIMKPDHALARRREVRLEDLSPYGLILPPQRLTTYRLVDLACRAGTREQREFLIRQLAWEQRGAQRHSAQYVRQFARRLRLVAGHSDLPEGLWAYGFMVPHVTERLARSDRERRKKTARRRVRQCRRARNPGHVERVGPIP